MASGLLVALELVTGFVVIVEAVVAKYGATNLGPAQIQATLASAPVFFVNVVATLVFTAGLTVAGAALSSVPWRERLRARRVALQLSVLGAATAGIAGVGTALSGLVGLGLVPRSAALVIFGQTVKSLSGTGVVLAMLVVGVLPGVTEELFFRGYVQTRLAERWGTTWGVAVSALLFGITHLDPVQGGFAVVVGCILGFLTVRTGSVVPAMICHGLNNVLAVVCAVWIRESASRPINVGLLAGGAAILVLAFLYLRERLPAAPGSIATRAEAVS